VTIRKLIPLLLTNIIGAIMIGFGLHSSDPIMFWCGFCLFMLLYIVMLTVFLYQEIRWQKIKKCSNIIGAIIKAKYKRIIDTTDK
jgi:hypothetical protein